MKARIILIVLALAAMLALAVGLSAAQGPHPTLPSGQPAGEPQAPAGSVPSTALGTGFTYQGQLNKNGNPVDATCDMAFRLYDASTDGSLVAAPITTTVDVAGGLFTLALDFPDTFQGEARFLEISVACPGDPGFSTLSPRQALTAVPYALSLRPGASIIEAVDSGSILFAHNTATSGETYGVVGQSDSTAGLGVYGYATATSGNNYGVLGQSDSTSGRGVTGYASATSGYNYGVYGWSNSIAGAGVFGSAPAYGVYGSASASSGETYGVYGESASTAGRGVYGTAPAYGVYGYASATSGNTYGVYGESASTAGRGVYGAAPVYGVWGYASATSGYTYGVLGLSASTAGRGVFGYAYATSGTTYGVRGQSDSTDGRGVFGYAGATSGNTYGVLGQSGSTNGTGVYGYAPDSGAGSGPGYAGYFFGDVHVEGTLSKSAGAFRIDHPLDPANKYLNHSFVESPDMKNVYDGVVLLDTKGEAWVQLPAWFEALNQDFRYQLTPIGAPMPNLYIAREIRGNRFQIAGGIPGMKVSWQVTGIRHDPFAEQNRIPVEEDKPADERGTYLYPEGYGQPKEKGLDYRRNPELFERVSEVGR